MQSARTITLAFIHVELFTLDSATKPCPLYNFKLFSRNFISNSINIRRRTKRKNHNSCIYTFWGISLGTLSVTKSCPLCNLKSVQDIFKKLQETSCKYQSTLDDVQSSRTITFALSFLNYFPWNYLHHKRRDHCITWKTVQDIFTKLYMNINQQ